MPVNGILRLRAAQTSAETADWAACIYPWQGVQSLGDALRAALWCFNAPVVALLSAGQGRLMVTTESAVKAALLALVPVSAATLAPVPVLAQTATQWTLVSDPWLYAGSVLPTVCLPQLSKRTAWGMVDKVLRADPATGFVLVNQDSGQLRVWSDFNGDAAAGFSAIVPSGATVCGEFGASPVPLIFEGGET